MNAQHRRAKSATATPVPRLRHEVGEAGLALRHRYKPRPLAALLAEQQQQQKQQQQPPRHSDGDDRGTGSNGFDEDTGRSAMAFSVFNARLLELK
jgi:hypothetical protein